MKMLHLYTLIDLCICNVYMYMDVYIYIYIYLYIMYVHIYKLSVYIIYIYGVSACPDDVFLRGRFSMGPLKEDHPDPNW